MNEWQPTTAQSVNPPPPGTDPEYDRNIAEWRERKRREAESITPPALDVVEHGPDPSNEPGFEPAPPDYEYDFTSASVDGDRDLSPARPNRPALAGPDPSTGPAGAPIVRSPGSALNVLGWADLMRQPPDPPPQIRPGIPAVGVTVIAGSPKIGKTTWSSQQAIESGETCLLVIEEGDLAGISYRLRRQASGLLVAEPPLSLMHRQRIRLDNRPDVRRIRDVVARLRPALVIFDPLNRLHGADENRPTQMTPVMDALAGIAYDYRTAVLAVHHLAKPSAERRGDIWDRFRGASAIRSGTDANLALDGSGERVRLVGEFRDAEPLSLYLELDRETLLFSEAERPEAPSKVDPIELRAFVEERRQVTAAQIMERFDVARHTALKALRALGCDEFEGPNRTLRFTLGAGVQ